MKLARLYLILDWVFKKYVLLFQPNVFSYIISLEEKKSPNTDILGDRRINKKFTLISLTSF